MGFRCHNEGLVLNLDRNWIEPNWNQILGVLVISSFLSIASLMKKLQATLLKERCTSCIEWELIQVLVDWHKVFEI